MEGRQRLILEDRRELTISGVSNVDGFDEQRILLNSALGAIEVCGEGLKIAALDLGAGHITINGRIDGLVYGQNREEHSLRQKSKSLVSRLLK